MPMYSRHLSEFTFVIYFENGRSERFYSLINNDKKNKAISQMKLVEHVRNKFMRVKSQIKTAILYHNPVETNDNLDGEIKRYYPARDGF